MTAVFGLFMFALATMWIFVVALAIITEINRMNLRDATQKALDEIYEREKQRSAWENEFVAPKIAEIESAHFQLVNGISAIYGGAKNKQIKQ